MSGRVRLDTPAMRFAVSAPVGVLLLYATFTDAVERPGFVFALLGVGTVLAVGTVWASTRPGGVSEAGQILAGLVGVGLLPALLVEGLSTPADAFGLLFVLVVVVAAFTMDGPPRWTLLVWTLAMWSVALVWDGLRDADLLLFHLGGGVIVLVTVVRIANALGDAVAAEARARADTEQRAELLARLLRVHTLERDDVLEAVADGLIDAGFDAASLRLVDGDELVLAAGRGSAMPMPERISRDVGLPGRAVRSGRVEAIVGPREEAVTQPGVATAGAVATPLHADDRLEGVITAVSHDLEISESQREAVELLASLAGRAIRRAGLYEADEATMTDLRRLEARTQDFVSTVSHELRTPLTVVQGLGQMLRTRWDDLAPDRRDDLLRRVDANASRLAQMVRSLLDTSAFEEGRIEIHPERIHLAPLLRVLLHRLASVTAAHPVTVDVPEDTTVYADRALLEHVLENLLTNTAKHTPQGTDVQVIARPAPGGGVELVVSDDGSGIPEADLPHVLDRFYRGGDPTSRPPGGLGLGLALVREILGAHGAELDLESVEGEGTRFAFVLPADRRSD